MRNLSDDQPLVSVIIPTKNSEATLEKCLKSIKEQDYKNLEIIVVDNYSSDKTRLIAKENGAKVYLKGPERGAQINFGVKMARGKYVYRVDSDFVLNHNVINEAVQNCEIFCNDAVLIHNTSDATVSFWAKVRKIERDSYKNDELNVAARFWKKEAFMAVGGFREDIIAGDDYDLHNRLIQKNFKIGRIKAEEIHIGEPKTLAEIIRKHYYYGKNIGKFIKKNPKKSLTQLSPVRISHFSNFSKLIREPTLLIGFAIYQYARYAATAIGIALAKF